MFIQEQWTINLFQDENGHIPFEKWFNQLDNSIKVRIESRLNRVRLGNFGDHKALSGGIYELRLQFGSGYRVYYGKVENRILLLLLGGDKSKQQSDIEQAKKYWRIFLESKS